MFGLGGWFGPGKGPGPGPWCARKRPSGPFGGGEKGGCEEGGGGPPWPKKGCCGCARPPGGGGEKLLLGRPPGAGGGDMMVSGARAERGDCGGGPFEDDVVPSVLGARERAGDARPGGGCAAATNGDCRLACMGCCPCGPCDEAGGGFENLKRLLVRPASSSPREADCAGRDAGDGASAYEFAGSFDRPGGKGAIATEASKPFVGTPGDAPRLPETWSMPSSLAILSASSLLGAFTCPRFTAGPLLPLPPAPMSDSKMLAGPVELVEASAGAGAGLPSKNLANRDERPPPRPWSSPSTGSRAAGEGDPRPGGARAMPRSSKIDLL